MATMLRTVNPDAAAQADPERDLREPYIGQMLLYHARLGEGVSGKLSFPAICINVMGDDQVELIVLRGTDGYGIDSQHRAKITRMTEQNPFDCWSFNTHDQEHYLGGKQKPVELDPTKPITYADLRQLFTEVAELRMQVARRQT